MRNLLNDLGCLVGVFLCVLCLSLLIEKNECRREKREILEHYNNLKARYDGTTFNKIH